MLNDFFLTLKEAGLPVTLKEHLALLEALGAGVIGPNIDEFYLLARTVMIKNETLYDRFDRVFSAYFKGMEDLAALLAKRDIPEEWLMQRARATLTEEQKKHIEALGGWDKIMETLRERLAQQKKRHEGGNKMIGTAGTSPFGAFGYNPAGVRIGPDGGKEGGAIKVWEQRAFRNLDGDVELGTRNFKIALRRLREFARHGAADEFDLSGTISATAKNAGWLDLHYAPQRRDRMKVLLLMDVGGTMDEHVRLTEELFSAARSELKHLVHYYFHNFIYETIWQDNRRRHADRTPLWELLRTYGPDYRLIIVGDATMSPYEILQPGGSIEHINEEPGSQYLLYLLDHFTHAVWLNPEPVQRWETTASIQLTKDLMSERMFPLTVDGLTEAITRLRTTTH